MTTDLLDAKKNLLLVDDEPGVLAILSESLSELGFHCHTAADGREALARLSETSIDLMITDICMPEMSGTELFQSARDAGYRCPIIFISGVLGEADLKWVDEADGFFYKPFVLRELLHQIKNLL